MGACVGAVTLRLGALRSCSAPRAQTHADRTALVLGEGHLGSDPLVPAHGCLFVAVEWDGFTFAGVAGAAPSFLCHRRHWNIKRKGNYVTLKHTDTVRRVTNKQTVGLHTLLN